MVRNLDTARRQPVELRLNPVADTSMIATSGTPKRSLVGLARRNGEWLRRSALYWLAAAEESVTAEHRELCLRCAQRFANLARANEECVSRLEQENS